MKAFKISIPIFLLAILSNPCFGMISVGKLSKDEAKELGITMKHRKNGDAGVKVWLELKKEGFLEKFTYCELKMTDASGEHVVSAMLQPNPANHRQLEGIVSIAFSADPAQLENCAFMIVAYGSTRGDVGYMLHVKDFFDTVELQKNAAEQGGADQPASAVGSQTEGKENGRQISLLVLKTTSWPKIRLKALDIQDTLENMGEGSYVELEF